MPGSLLSQAEQVAAIAQVRELITSSGQTAVLLRRRDGEDLYGADDGTFAEVCAFPLELNETPPVDLAKTADARASVLPELDVRVTDRVSIGATDYRVQTVADQSLFGAITHRALELALLHGNQTG